MVGIKIHGYGMFFGVSRGDAAKDSNHHCEMMAKCLTSVAKHFNLNLAQMHIHIQSDNCVREVKNNTVARWCSAMVAKSSSNFDSERFR